MKKLAIITTHPIQYNAPWFRLLAQRKDVDLKVFYTWSQTKDSVKDRTFGKDIKWDIPLLEGYAYTFVENTSKNPGSHHFFGIDCPTLIDDIKAYEPNAILFFGWNFKSHLLAMRHFKGKIPIWFRGDSTLLNEVSGYKTQLRRLVLKKVYSYIDTAFYVGAANKAYFSKHNLKDDQLVYAPHAIDIERFSDDEHKSYETQAIQWRKELGYAAEDIVILYAGKFEPVKQLELLIKSIISVNTSIPKPIKLLLVGTGPLELTLKELAQDSKDIQFLGFQNQTQMPIVYRLGTIFCLPSKSETWGLAINEAMACGKPVIVSSKVGCAKDLVKSAENGYVFPYNSSTALKDIMESLSADELQRLGGNAKNDIKAFSFETIVTAVEHQLSKLQILKTKHQK